MGGTTVQEAFGLAGAIVILAGITVAIVNGGKTAQVVGAIGSTFYKSLAVATQQKVPR